MEKRENKKESCNLNLNICVHILVKKDNEHTTISDKRMNRLRKSVNVTLAPLFQRHQCRNEDEIDSFRNCTSPLFPHDLKEEYQIKVQMTTATNALSINASIFSSKSCLQNLAEISQGTCLSNYSIPLSNYLKESSLTDCEQRLAMLACSCRSLSKWELFL